MDELLEHNARHAERLATPHLAAPPTRRLAILTCMDARIDPLAIFGLAVGEAHVVRNAGGLATDDAIRSLLLSQWLLGTTDVLVLHHTGCGLEGLDEAQVIEDIAAARGATPGFPLGSFEDVAADTLVTVERLARSPLLATAALRGFVYDVATGQVREVTSSDG